MCIRDSQYLDAQGPVDAGGVAELRRREGAARLGLGHHVGCLLYTSDAADDPLCVDLGGGRTIKKKNCTPARFRQSASTPR